MRYIRLLPLATILLLAGCIYEAPLTGEQGIAIDPAVLGLWEPVTGDGEEPGLDDRLLILRYSETEYLVHHPMGEEGVYYRAYPVRIGKVSCIQLEALGNAEGPPEEGDDERFIVASYELTQDELEIRLLNSDLVSEELKESAALRKAFLEHQDDEALFIDPERFRRIDPSPEKASIPLNKDARARVPGRDLSEARLAPATVQAGENA
jgi:hypothetical protein